MKKTLSILFVAYFLVAIQVDSNAQKSFGDLYHPMANAAQDIDGLIEKAKLENKHIVLQIGGNWCSWCYLFHDFIDSNKEIKTIVDSNYLVYHLNYSSENKNIALLEKYRHPERFGFPVLVILDSNGELIHTQNSALLEKDKGYDLRNTKEFFNAWTPTALDPATYKE